MSFRHPTDGDGPQACVVLDVDLGTVEGVRVLGLTVDLWKEHAVLNSMLLGPHGWLDEEPRPLGRWTVTATSGSSTGPFGGHAGTEGLLATHVVLGPRPLNEQIDLVSFHRRSQEVSVGVAAAPVGRRVVSARIDRAPMTDPASTDQSCPICLGVNERPGHACTSCRSMLEVVFAACDGAASAPAPRSIAIMAEVATSWAGAITFVSLTIWDGWCSLRYHVTHDDGGSDGRLRGSWTITDAHGQRHRGFETHSHVGQGWIGDVAFAGRLDLAEGDPILTIAHGDRTLIEVELPLAAP